MLFQEVNIGKNKRAGKKVKVLYRAAFPKEERLPFWVLQFLTVQRSVVCTAYFEGDKFCGFAYTVTSGDLLFVLFFAVCESLRGQGVGSAILSQMKEKGKTVILNIEPPDENAENYEERLCRKRFYEKNGFFDTGYDIEEIGGTFRVFSTEKSLDVTAYKKVFRRMTFGFWDVKIEKLP